MAVNPIKKTLAEVRALVIERIIARQAEGNFPINLNLNRGVARGFIEVFVFMLFQVYSLLGSIFTAMFPQTAKGFFLDEWASSVNLTRRIAKTTNGVIRFFRINGTNNNINIDAGTIVSTSIDVRGFSYNFVVLERVTLLENTLYIDVKVAAQSPGADFNVPVGAINTLVDAIQNIDRVANLSGWLTVEGLDLENDTELQKRYLLQWSSLDPVNKFFYENLALQVLGVNSVNVVGPAINRSTNAVIPGQVDIIIRGEAGAPSQQVINNVKELVAINKPVLDTVNILPVTEVVYNIQLTITYRSGNEADIRALIITNLLNMNKIDDDGTVSVEVGIIPSRDSFVLSAQAGISKDIIYNVFVSNYGSQFDVDFSLDNNEIINVQVATDSDISFVIYSG